MPEKTHASILTSDPILRRIMEKIEVPRIVSTKDVFHDLMGCIIEQQIHYRSTKKIYQRLLDKASIEQLNLENFAQFEEKALPTLKLSMNKIETINA
jgi:DNA-3-methyladenine glycosylase II